jgi:hypothetical protein
MNIVEYKCRADVTRIPMQIGFFFFHFETDTNNKIIDSYLIVRQVYNAIIHK